MKKRDLALIPNRNAANLQSNRLSDEVMIEIIHGIKEVILDLLNRKYHGSKDI